MPSLTLMRRTVTEAFASGPIARSSPAAPLDTLTGSVGSIPSSGTTTTHGKTGLQ